MSNRILLALLCLSLVACGTPPADAAGTPPQAAALTATLPAPSPTVPTPTLAFPTPVPTVTSSPVFPTVPFVPDCTATKGTVTNFNYHAYHLGYSLFYDVYLPPCYEASADTYPVLYLLHGQAFIEDQWDRLGANEAADSLIAAGKAPPFIMIMPRGGANPYFGQGFIEDLLPYVESEFRIKTDREHRAIGGLSRGAGWAIYLGLKYPDMFSIIGAHSPAIQYIHAAEIDNLLDALEPDQRPRIWLDIGDKDSLISNTEWFIDMLDEREMEYTFNMYSGKHEEAYWSAHVREYLLFYASAW